MIDLPEKFIKRMQERLGKDYPAFLASYREDPAKGLRINTLKLSKEEFFAIAPAEFKLQGPVTGDGVYTEGEKLGADPYHFAGLYYLQEPSAMKVGDLTLACRKERVLDLCAAPGGKTTLIAQQMGGKGILIANEIDYKRAKILSENVERMGIRNCAVLSASPETVAEKFPAYFDLVLVDAPCSGEGMFKKEENAIPEWSEENVAMCAARQRMILDRAAETVCAGGNLVYSTCTFSEEEDEGQVEAFLARHPDFTLKRQQKLYPHTFRGEGHFMALLERASDPLSYSRLNSSPSEGTGKRRGHSKHSAETFSAKSPSAPSILLRTAECTSSPRTCPTLRGSVWSASGSDSANGTENSSSPPTPLRWRSDRKQRKKYPFPARKQRDICGAKRLNGIRKTAGSLSVSASFRSGSARRSAAPSKITIPKLSACAVERRGEFFYGEFWRRRIRSQLTKP